MKTQPAPKGDSVIRESELAKDAVESFIRWNLIRIDADATGSAGNAAKDKAAERRWALSQLCEKAGLLDVYEKINGSAAP
jgi:hypothetical protein